VLVWEVPRAPDELPTAPRTLRADHHPVWALAFRPGGEVLAAADEVGGVELWHPASGERLLRLQTSLKLLRAASFDPTGTRLALGTYVHGGMVWDLAGLERALTDVMGAPAPWLPR